MFRKKRDTIHLLAFAIFGITFCQFTYFMAIQASNAGTATVLQYLSPILILAVVLVGFVKGLMCGFFRQVVSIVGFLAGLWVAFMLYSVLGDWIAPYIGSDVSVGRALAFILLWIGVPVGLSLLAYMLTKAVETVKLGGLNRLGGALLGGLKYMVFLSCALNVAFRIHLISGSTGEHSRLYHPVRAMSDKLFEVCKTHVVRVVEDAASPACGQDPKKQLR